MQELTKALVRNIPKSGPTDPIEFYRRPLIGWLFRERINRGLRLLGPHRFDRALEVGYGAGALQLLMARDVEEIHGIDLDADPALVEPLLREGGYQPHLRRGNVLELPYDDGHFDLVVCISVIEHIRDYRRALEEMARVLTDSGQLLLGMPSVNMAMEIGFRAIGFKGIDDHHVSTPAQISSAVNEAGLRIERMNHLDLPISRPFGLRLYNNWLLTKAP
ncbi:MAG: class I SAM-dependent methyltransferase [bacterium]|nr:class I SAM-dependent methyltransferase [bacterium]MCP5065872.1 class I SAM-dependent methyltransferase [bacterium]